MGRRRAPRRAENEDRGLVGALALTFGSAVLWGLAHIRAGRRAVGFSLLLLFVALIAGTATVVLAFRSSLETIAVQHTWLDGITVGILVLALIWATVVIRSYQVVRPAGMRLGARTMAGTLVVVLAVGICTPLVWAARDAYTLRNAITSIFPGDRHHTRPIDTDNPWEGRPRVNILLLGGDAAGDRIGTRTDSITVASIDTKTGDTVLISVPRNLQRFPMVPRLQSKWPDGFTGYPGDEGLINELFQDAIDHPDLVPGYTKEERGPQLVKESVAYLLGIHIDYYVLVNLFGFADIMDAMGGVKLHIKHSIPYGGPEDGSNPTGVIQPGYRTLPGKKALWYGRSRTASSDFDRMARQKCLLRAIAEQADPQTVLTRFQELAKAAKEALATNIPEELLPALIELSGTMKHGAEIHSLMFVPPTIHVYRPDIDKMRALTAKALAEKPKAHSRKSATSTHRKSRRHRTDTPTAGPSSSPTEKAVSLSSTCD